MGFIVKSILIVLIMFPGALYSEEVSNPIKEEKINQELSNTLPVLAVTNDTKNKSEQPVQEPLDINSQKVVKSDKVIPNDGKIYFTLSGGLAPYQFNLGILKYFIPEFWGQLELNLVFFPDVPVSNYYTALSYFKPYVGFKVIAGYSFYTYKKLEISLFVQFQFSFISLQDVPIIPSLGFRFAIDFFWIDIGVGYSISAGGTSTPIFQGFSPTISLGFRF
ncbi:MAG: hypothetical protein ACRCTQ_04975 [Brevinemataceae bacterium]